MADDINKDLQERFAHLPKVVQDAITSADVEKRLRELADTHKLHLDQWQQLENEVMLVLLGCDSPGNITANIKSEVGVSDEIAAALTADISRVVFEPIRQELERELEHPDAKAKEESDVEGMRTQMLSNTTNTGPETTAVVAPAIVPATPPSPPPTEKAIRMPASGAYKPGEASVARKDIADDPYRETPA